MRMASPQTPQSAPSSPPFLRWAGSKRQLLQRIRQHVPADAARYIEPFAGSARLFFHLLPHHAILSDINFELIKVYRAVRRSPEAVGSLLHDLRRSKREYLRLRSLRPGCMTSSERAARFIYLNRFCFNGLYRTNRKGEFNVPYGASGTGRLPDTDMLRACSRALRRTTLIAADFEEVLRQVRRGDFVYMDPPYAVNSRRVFNEYHHRSFSFEDVSRIRRVMERLDRKKVSFLVSYAESAEGKMLSKGFAFEMVTVRRNIAGFTNDRKYSREILIWNQ